MIFWTTLLILHGLLALALLGAITYQTLALWWPVSAPAGSFVARFRAVPGVSYVGAIIVLYVLTFILGAWIYTQYALPPGWRWSSFDFSRRSASSS
jgi:hypothetical protein